MEKELGRRKIKLISEFHGRFEKEFDGVKDVFELQV